MVYCNLINFDDKEVRYKFGRTVSDLTGVLVVRYGDGTFEVEKEPDKGMPMIKNIVSLLSAHLEEFKDGVFKEKIAREI